MDYLTDLESTCAALGTNDGAGSYHKDDDCLECVKDLIRFLRRDDGNNHTLRQALGQIGVVKSDLLPILREYSSDDDLFDMVESIEFGTSRCRFQCDLRIETNGDEASR